MNSVTFFWPFVLLTIELCITYIWPLNSELFGPYAWTLHYILLTSKVCNIFLWTWHYFLLTSEPCVTYYGPLNSELLIPSWPLDFAFLNFDPWTYFSRLDSALLTTGHWTLCYYWPLNSVILTFDPWTLWYLLLNHQLYVTCYWLLNCALLLTVELCVTCYWSLRYILLNADLWYLCYILLISKLCSAYYWPLSYFLLLSQLCVTFVWNLHYVLLIPADLWTLLFPNLCSLSYLLLNSQPCVKCYWHWNSVFYTTGLLNLHYLLLTPAYKHLIPDLSTVSDPQFLPYDCVLPQLPVCCSCIDIISYLSLIY